MSTTPRLTLCTYTRDDAPLVLGLLDSVSGWTVRPDEIVVVDDGSRTPLDASRLPPGARLLRNAAPQGPMRAKVRGLGAARGEFLLSVDCDMRLSPNWVAAVLEHAARPEVGIACSVWSYVERGAESSGRAAATAEAHDPAGPQPADAPDAGLAQRYLRVYVASEVQTGEVELMPGTAWLLRRAVWEEVGGFSGFTMPTHEDLLFCARVRAAGYTLYRTGAAAARQVRRLSHTAVVRRQWIFVDGMYRAGLARKPLAERVDGMGARSLARAALFLRSGRRELCYVELLFLVFAHLRLLLDHALPGLDAAEAAGAQLGALGVHLAPYARLRAELAADLLRLGVPAVRAVRPVDRCPRLAELLDLLRRADALRWLDAHAPEFLARDRARAADYSFYERMRPGDGPDLLDGGLA